MEETQITVESRDIMAGKSNVDEGAVVVVVVVIGVEQFVVGDLKWVENLMWLPRLEEIRLSGDG